MGQRAQRMQNGTHEKVTRLVRTLNLWHFVWLSIAASEAFTAVMSRLLRGRITSDYLITGGVVSLVVSTIVVYLIRLTRDAELRAANFSRTVLNSMKDAVSVIDVKDFRIVGCNEVFLRELGFQEEDVIGKTCYEITHQRSSPCIPPEESCPSRETVKTGAYAAAEHVHYTREGKKKYVKVSTNPIKDGNGEVTMVVHVSSDITEIKQLHLELERRAETDCLTGAYNRMKYEELIQKELERGERYGRPLSLVMFDIDHFKQVNDRHGHAFGDRVLKSVACIADEHKRKVDSLFRWGGEEFMIVSPDTDLEQAMFLAERIRTAVEQREFNGAGKVTVSLGITRLRTGDTADELIKRVDAALYKAKANGRNRVELLA